MNVIIRKINNLFLHVRSALGRSFFRALLGLAFFSGAPQKSRVILLLCSFFSSSSRSRSHFATFLAPINLPDFPTRTRALLGPFVKNF